MEVAWEDRGKIPHDAYHQPYGPERGFEFEKLNMEMKHWWNRVFDACRDAKYGEITDQSGEMARYFRVNEITEIHYDESEKCNIFENGDNKNG
jgi:hypothetical protein